MKRAAAGQCVLARVFCCGLVARVGSCRPCRWQDIQGVCCLGSEVFDFVMVSQGSRNFEGRCVVERR